MSLIPTSAGFTNINVLNVNALYIQGQLFDSAIDAGLQAQIDAINAQLLNIDAVVDKFDVSGLPNPNKCIITTATTNQRWHQCSITVARVKDNSSNNNNKNRSSNNNSTN